MYRIGEPWYRMTAVRRELVSEEVVEFPSALAV